LSADERRWAQIRKTIHRASTCYLRHLRTIVLFESSRLCVRRFSA
jgi:hypothetical protein